MCYTPVYELVSCTGAFYRNNFNIQKQPREGEILLKAALKIVFHALHNVTSRNERKLGRFSTVIILGNEPQILSLRK